MATEKEKKIDPKSIREYIKYDDESGLLYWLKREIDAGGFNAKFAGREAFTSKERKGYKQGALFGVYLKAHRVAWAIYYGEWPEDQIDHINGIPWDNRIDNLRQSVNKDNCRNQSKPKSNTSGWMGVSFVKSTGVWMAKYRKDYVDYTVGYFSCPTKAGLAVMKHRSLEGFSDGHGRDRIKLS